MELDTIIVISKGKKGMLARVHVWNSLVTQIKQNNTKVDFPRFFFLCDLFSANFVRRWDCINTDKI